MIEGQGKEPNVAKEMTGPPHRSGRQTRKKSGLCATKIVDPFVSQNGFTIVLKSDTKIGIMNVGHNRNEVKNAIKNELIQAGKGFLEKVVGREIRVRVHRCQVCAMMVENFMNLIVERARAKAKAKAKVEVVVMVHPDTFHQHPRNVETIFTEVIAVLERGMEVQRVIVVARGALHEISSDTGNEISA